MTMKVGQTGMTLDVAGYETVTAKRKPPQNNAFAGVLHGSGCWTRTSDPLINSQLLYQLS
jgi:hypothetical protein